MNIEKRITRKEYKVITPGGTHKAFYNGVFGKHSQPLCDALDDNMPGCQDAVAATSWQMRFKPGEDKLYSAEGEKQTLECSCDINMLLPKWVPKRKLGYSSAKSVSSFISATETHERGHAVACESLANSIKLLAKNMPNTINPLDVDAMNLAFTEFSYEFYARLARQADVVFDEITHHGGDHDAELDDEPDNSSAASSTELEGKNGGLFSAVWSEDSDYSDDSDDSSQGSSTESV
jgi:hypothetical protein